MSKASEWAEEYQRRVQASQSAPLFVGCVPGGGGYGERQGGAGVGGQGQLILMNCEMEPRRALLLAQWILEVFGETR